MSCELTSNYPCVTSSTAASNVLTMTVITPSGVPATPSPITGTVDVCPGTTYTYSVTADPNVTYLHLDESNRRYRIIGSWYKQYNLSVSNDYDNRSGEGEGEKLFRF
ncbi:MAG: hypothetical protein U0T74_12385 [Chitinophagales bacterium]